MDLPVLCLQLPFYSTNVADGCNGCSPVGDELSWKRSRRRFCC